ncbi:hypothetical protein QEV83_13830 [Methylocapsa sp. D3K7]|uniref:hypothetical protein n=1 Tax=Methylocapsa sp. D3K7 TaxID=3041435 RepID=UPI00244ED837|nr:hypothetical protein [Methylocapsa sp. D3K7]WGJ13755.1 hypothetical protein QEV83_13830 [Methylocapsa sp. D3K7]
MNAKTRKAPAAAPIFDAKKTRLTLQEAHAKMNEACQLLKLINLAADQFANGDVDDLDYIHGIFAASNVAVRGLNDAYNLIDYASMEMAPLIWPLHTSSAEPEVA